MPCLIVSCPPDMVRDPKVWNRALLLLAFLVTSNSFDDTMQPYYSTLMSGRITSWTEDSYYPHGEVVKAIGAIGDIDAETQAILCGNTIDASDFPPEVWTNVFVEKSKLDMHF